MKSLLLLLALSSCAYAGAPAAPADCVPQKVVLKTGMTMPDGKKIRVDVVATPAEREIGLMCVTKMPKDYGMLFVFPNEMFLNFWMKNTLVPLDILWIGADKKITIIHANLPASTTSTPDDKIATAGGKGQYVLELAAGESKRRKLKAGDKLNFAVAIPAK